MKCIIEMKFFVQFHQKCLSSRRDCAFATGNIYTYTKCELSKAVLRLDHLQLCQSVISNTSPVITSLFLLSMQINIVVVQSKSTDTAVVTVFICVNGRDRAEGWSDPWHCSQLCLAS